MGSSKASDSRNYVAPWFVFASFGLALCFLFRDTNRYTTITFPTSDSLLDPVVLAFGRLLPLVILAIAYTKGMSRPSQKIDWAQNAPRVWKGFFVSRISRILIITFLTVFGIGMLFVSELGVDPTPEMITFGILFLGLGNTLFLVTYAELLLPNGRKITFSVFIAASFLYGILRMLLGLLSPEAALILLLACPALSCFCLCEALRPKYAKGDETIPSEPLQRTSPPTVASRFRISLLVGIAGYSFLLSELHFLWTRVPVESMVLQILVQISTGLGILLGTFIISKLRSLLSSEYSSSYSILLFSVFIAVLYLSTFLSNDLVALYVIPLYAAQRIVFFLIWSLASFSVFPKVRMKSFCLGMLCLESGVFAYYLLDALVEYLGLSSSDISMVVVNVVLVFLLGKELITWFFLERKRAGEKSAQLPQQDNRAPVNENDMTEVFNAVASHYRLTKRERELLPFLLLGRSPEYIGKALFIEPSTVKTHIRNIYGKMAVGKKTDLIYIIENWNTGDGP